MGLGDILFGPDGVGGQPGLAGKALDFAMGTDIDVNAPDPKTGQGQLAKYGKDLARLPFTLAKLPVDFLTDPTTFLDGREIDIGAILSPTYRKEKKQARKEAADFERARNVFEGIKMFDDFTAGMSATPFDQRAAVAQQAEQAGLPSEQIDTALGAANQVDQQRASVIAAIRAEDPTIPDEVLANLDPDKGLAILTRIRESQAIQARADASAARAQAREARLAGQPRKRTPQEVAAAARGERAATKVFDSTYENEQQGLAIAADQVTDPVLARGLRAKIPEFAAKRAAAAAEALVPLKQRQRAFRAKKAAARSAVDKAVPLTSRKNIAISKAAHEAVAATKLPQPEPAQTVTVAPEDRPRALAEVRSFIAKKEGVDPSVLRGLLKAAGVPADIIEEAMAENG